MITYTPAAEHGALHLLLSEECRTPDDFVRYCNKQGLKSDGARSLGLVSYQDLLDLMIGKMPSGVPTSNLQRAYDALVEADVFRKIPFGPNKLFEFQINFQKVLIYTLLGCLDNIIKGPIFTLLKYTPSVVAIVVEKDGQQSAGTGSLMTNGVDDFILTNKHVVDADEGWKIKEVLMGGSQSTPLKSKLSIRVAEDDDLAMLSMPKNDDLKNFAKFRISPNATVLQKVTTLGYPAIPRTNNFHITAHTGEINALIKTRDDEELYLISCYASPGSSGGPVLDAAGLVVGVVSERLEGKYQDGLFGHTAAVPQHRVLKFLNNKF